MKAAIQTLYQEPMEAFSSETWGTDLGLLFPQLQLFPLTSTAHQKRNAHVCLARLSTTSEDTTISYFVLPERSQQQSVTFPFPLALSFHLDRRQFRRQVFPFITSFQTPQEITTHQSVHTPQYFTHTHTFRLFPIIILYLINKGTKLTGIEIYRFLNFLTVMGSLNTTSQSQLHILLEGTSPNALI